VSKSGRIMKKASSAIARTTKRVTCGGSVHGEFVLSHDGSGCEMDNG
jgi:hypothetical protein